MITRVSAIALAILLLAFSGCSGNASIGAEASPPGNAPAAASSPAVSAEPSVQPLSATPLPGSTQDDSKGGSAVAEHIYYIEKYQLPGDSGDGLSASEAAEAVAKEIVMFLMEDISADEPRYVTLVDLDFIEERECYIFEVSDKQENVSLVCASGYDGTLYVFTEKDGEYHRF